MKIWLLTQYTASTPWLCAFAGEKNSCLCAVRCCTTTRISKSKRKWFGSEELKWVDRSETLSKIEREVLMQRRHFYRILKLLPSDTEIPYSCDVKWHHRIAVTARFYSSRPSLGVGHDRTQYRHSVEQTAMPRTTVLRMYLTFLSMRRRSIVFAFRRVN